MIMVGVRDGVCLDEVRGRVCARVRNCVSVSSCRVRFLSITLKNESCVHIEALLYLSLSLFFGVAAHTTPLTSFCNCPLTDLRTDKNL